MLSGIGGGALGIGSQPNPATALSVIQALTRKNPQSSPGDLPTPPMVANRIITSRAKDKFAMGWLGGIGGSSQFQGTSSLLPVRVPANNTDLDYYILQSRGRTMSGQRLLTRWERPLNFNPGLGVDTWREGGNVTWNPRERGQFLSPMTGVSGPLVYEARDQQTQGPIAPTNDRAQGIGMWAPTVLVEGITGTPNGTTLADIQQAAQSSQVSQRRAFLNRTSTRGKPSIRRAVRTPGGTGGG